MEQVGSPLLVDGLGWIDNSGKELVRRRGWRALAVGLLGLVSFAGGFYLVQGTAGPGAPQVPWGVALIIVGFLTFPAGLTLSFSRSGYLSRLAGIPDRVRVEETGVRFAWKSGPGSDRPPPRARAPEFIDWSTVARVTVVDGFLGDWGRQIEFGRTDGTFLYVGDLSVDITHRVKAAFDARSGPA